MDFEALWLTLRLAVGTTAILLVVALPLAWWIASGRGAGRACFGDQAKRNARGETASNA